MTIGRREFIAALGATAWPLAAQAQQPDRMRRIGVLLPGPADDPVSQARNVSFLRAMQELGWIVGRNLRIDYRWAEGQIDRLPRLAGELVASKVDVIVAGSAVATLAASRATTSIPIVQTGGGDPVRSSLVAESSARPHGNVTGLTNQSEDLSGKLLDLLLKMVPGASRVAVLFASNAPVTRLQLSQIQDSARPLHVTLFPIPVPPADAPDSAFDAIALENVAGMVVLSGVLINVQARRIVALAAKSRLPAIYPYRSYVDAGGLMSYGVNFIYGPPQAARFVDRILKGAHPADLPIEQPTKFELVINLKTAKALGIDVPPGLLAITDEVIE